MSNWIIYVSFKSNTFILQQPLTSKIWWLDTQSAADSGGRGCAARRTLQTEWHAYPGKSVNYGVINHTKTDFGI